MIREWSMFCMSALPTSPMVRRYCKQLNICIRLIQTISVYWTNRFYCTSELYVQTTLSITQSHQIHFVVVDCWMYLQQNKTIVLRHHQYVKCPEEILKRTHIYANIIHKTQHQYKKKKTNKNQFHRTLVWYACRRMSSEDAVDACPSHQGFIQALLHAQIPCDTVTVTSSAIVPVPFVTASTYQCNCILHRMLIKVNRHTYTMCNVNWMNDCVNINNSEGENRTPPGWWSLFGCFFSFFALSRCESVRIWMCSWSWSLYYERYSAMSFRLMSISLYPYIKSVRKWNRQLFCGRNSSKGNSLRAQYD